ncbi:GNAT family N-acetyltransferase [Actinoplanes sp. N902-109]|uniref:GNAT family N-acetyltransferase n=1 Tax=Actinoplanes sp. (strain N902-109) TaxID=649831 RepID=UPI0003295923|nr:GNAT family N-acetyltransferase [Actinoplanes sp. N902-109]AGL20641.1 MarR family transcriptional regulator [Actinoplanes sp. N902-109]
MGATIRRLAEPGDLGWVVMAHGEDYVGGYGWSPAFEALVARIVADFAAAGSTAGDPAGAAAGAPVRSAAWIGEVDGERAGSVFCVAADDTTAQLRLLLVRPGARGHGLGSALVDECVRFATGAGYQRLTLWTVSAQVSARRIYQAAGFELVDEAPHRGFGPDLVGQNWARKL